jgi:hypothetical protein
MKRLRAPVALLVLASMVAGCAPQQAPIVGPPTPQQKATIIQEIQNDPKMSPAEKQQYLYWQGKSATSYTQRGTEPTNGTATASPNK